MRGSGSRGISPEVEGRLRSSSCRRSGARRWTHEPFRDGEAVAGGLSGGRAGCERVRVDEARDGAVLGPDEQSVGHGVPCTACKGYESEL